MKIKDNEINPVALTSSLISIASSDEEKKAVEYIQNYLEDWGFEIFIDEVEPNRPNILARLENKKDGPSLMLCGHLDTVPPAYDSQLKPKIQDDNLYGRGSADMKGGVAAMLSTLAYLAVNRDKWAGTILFLGTMGEEVGLLGMHGFVEKNMYGNKVDSCIIGEPTELKIGVAHKGMAWLNIRTKGKEAHSSRPQQGINAIYYMSIIVQAIEEKLGAVIGRQSHPLLEPPTVNVAIIHGGTRANVVPHECNIEVDRRVLPGESLDKVLDEIRDVIDPLKAKHPKLEYEISVKKFNGPFEMNSNAQVVAVASKAVASCSGKQAEIIGLPFGTDASELAVKNVPTIIIGPGSPNQAHMEDEHIEIKQIEAAYEIYKKICLDFLDKS